MSHLSPTRAQGLRQTVACLWTWQTTKPIEPERRDFAPELVGVTDCRVLDWCVVWDAWWKRHKLTVRQIAAPFGYLGLFCLIASVVFMVMAIWPDGMAR